MQFKRFILIVLDGFGIGEMPDAGKYGDAGSDTLGNMLKVRPMNIPHLRELGIANIRRLPNLDPHPSPRGGYGKGAFFSNGKDTTTGHWEMSGIITEIPFPTYPTGFPPHIISAFEAAVGRKVLGNVPASGTEIIARLGQEHMETGRPIVYTSADSVFQIAAHEEIIPLDELYRMCKIAREILTGKDRVGRVIARPFVGQPGSFKRTSNRHDYAVLPPEPTLLDKMKERGLDVVGIGKIPDIFCKSGVTEEIHTVSNMNGVDKTLESIKRDSKGLIFTNLVDFDMLYGHRNDIEGYARALEDFDARLPEIYSSLREDDCLMLSADHGNDPTTPSTDHSREYVPILAYSPRLSREINLGTRATLADIGQTIAENFGFRLGVGESFLSVLS
jgi:phosphopentomutase